MPTERVFEPPAAPDGAASSIGAAVGAVIANYGTPELTRAAVWSLRSHYPHLRIVVVENGSPDDSAARLRPLTGEAAPLDLLEPSRNLHHGPGL